MYINVVALNFKPGIRTLAYQASSDHWKVKFYLNGAVKPMVRFITSINYPAKQILNYVSMLALGNSVVNSGPGTTL